MGFSCFRAAPGGANTLPDNDGPARPVQLSRAKRASTFRRNASSSTSRTSSNASIAQLPPCNRDSDPKIEAMMMPVPPDPRPSRCLRLSHPRIFANIVTDMKLEKGCRDWKNFAVFHPDDVDMSTSAEQYARRKADDYQKKWAELSSFSDDESPPLVDTIC